MSPAATAAAWWINCPGAATMAAGCPAPGDGSLADAAALARKVGGLRIRHAAGLIGLQEYGEIFGALMDTRAGASWCPEMDEATERYCGDVLQIFREAQEKDPETVLMVEQAVSLEPWAPGSAGACDALIISGGKLETIDFRYGKGTRLVAAGDPHIRLLALGAAEAFRETYHLEKVRLTIMQPRISRSNTKLVELQKLLQWGAETVRPAAAAVEAGRTDRKILSCGPWCRWCPAKFSCRHRAEANLELTQISRKN